MDNGQRFRCTFVKGCDRTCNLDLGEDGSLPVSCGDKEGVLYTEKFDKEILQRAGVGEGVSFTECVTAKYENSFRYTPHNNEGTLKWNFVAQKTLTCSSSYMESASSRTCSKCIIIEFTPEEFVKQNVTLRGGDWKEEPLCHGKIFNYLLKGNLMDLPGLLEFLTEEDLLKFFHCKKTEISCMEEPRTFLHQLRDHKLVDEKLYQKVIRMKSKERRQEGVYEILDRLETERGQCVKMFWTCVFKDHILQKYPVFRMLQKTLLDGSFNFNEMLPGPEEPSNKEEGEKKVKGKKRGEKRKKSVEEIEEEEEEEEEEGEEEEEEGEGEEEEEEAGPSSCSTPAHKKPTRRLIFLPPLKKGEKAEIWKWDLYKTCLPVTCGALLATLHRRKLAQGKECILYNEKWFSPSNFEKAAGKGSCKNWKLSIRCHNTSLRKLIEENHLQCPHRRIRSRRVLFPVVCSESSRSEMEGSDEGGAEDEEEEENTKGKVNEKEEKEKKNEEEEGESEPIDLSEFEGEVLPVSCGSITGDLYKKRFAGSRSKSIRTAVGWFTPEEFVQQDGTLRNGHWKKDILCHGKFLYFLVKYKILFVHSLQCGCDLCCPKDPLAQNNDDVCFVCNTNEHDDEELVCCDECPRAFHKHCHLPTPHDDNNEDKWMCTFCVWKINQQIWLHMSLKDTLNSPVTQNIMRCEYLLLCLYKEDTQRMFTDDPYVTMQRPSDSMWLNRVKTKLQKKNYSTVGEFVNDIRLIFKNDPTLNRDNDFETMRARLREIFEQMFQSIFKIQ